MLGTEMIENDGNLRDSLRLTTLEYNKFIQPICLPCMKDYCNDDMFRFKQESDFIKDHHLSEEACHNESINVLIKYVFIINISFTLVNDLLQMAQNKGVFVTGFGNIKEKWPVQDISVLPKVLQQVHLIVYNDSRYIHIDYRIIYKLVEILI